MFNVHEQKQSQVKVICFLSKKKKKTFFVWRKLPTAQKRQKKKKKGINPFVRH